MTFGGSNGILMNRNLHSLTEKILPANRTVRVHGAGIRSFRLAAHRDVLQRHVDVRPSSFQPIPCRSSIVDCRASLRRVTFLRNARRTSRVTLHVTSHAGSAFRGTIVLYADTRRSRLTCSSRRPTADERKRADEREARALHAHRTPDTTGAETRWPIEWTIDRRSMNANSGKLPTHTARLRDVPRLTGPAPCSTTCYGAVRCGAPKLTEGERSHGPMDGIGALRERGTTRLCAHVRNFAPEWIIDKGCPSDRHQWLIVLSSRRDRQTKNHVKSKDRGEVATISHDDSLKTATANGATSAISRKKADHGGLRGREQCNQHRERSQSQLARYQRSRINGFAAAFIFVSHSDRFPEIEIKKFLFTCTRYTHI